MNYGFAHLDSIGKAVTGGTMGRQIVNLCCPGCGARVDTSQNRCEWCNQPIVFTTFNDVYTMPASKVNRYAGAYQATLHESPESGTLNKSLGICYLKLHLYDKALAAFEHALDDSASDSEVYFYAAVCLLRGKKAFLAQKKDITKIDETIIFNGREYKYYRRYNKYYNTRKIKKLIYKCVNIRKNQRIILETNQGIFCNATIEYIEENQHVVKKFKHI